MKRLQFIGFVAAAAAAAACSSDTTKSTSATASTVAQRKAPTAPTIEVQVGSPLPGQSTAKPRGGQDLVARVFVKAVGEDGPLDPATYTYAWRLLDNDSRFEVLVEDLTEPVVPGDRVVKGQKWTVEVTAVDGLVRSKPARASVIIENGRPSLGSVTLTLDPSMPPTYVVPGETLGSKVLDLTDPDKDDVTLRFEWHRLRAGVDRALDYEELVFPGSQKSRPKTGAYLSTAGMQDGDLVRVLVTPTDASGVAGDPVVSAWMPVVDGYVLDKVRGVGTPGSTKAASFEFSPIVAGSFVMGAGDADTVADATARPAFKATLTENFLIARTETTMAQWLAVMGDDGADRTADELALPVSELTWTEAADFCNKLSASLKLLPAAYTSNYELVPGAAGFRLPTEAQWEYAARAGLLKSTYGEQLDDVAWYDPPPQAECLATSSCRGGAICYKADPFAASGVCAPTCDPNSLQPCTQPDYTCELHADGATYACIAPPRAPVAHPVARKQGNAWRLYDILGNAWEWTSDWYWGYSTLPLVDPVGPMSGLVLRVARGGGYASADLSFALRRPLSPSVIPDVPDVGFRVIRPLP
ncbi:MAG: hypothetical protein RL199_84 [Pseudomonadota bacterium]|jgi:formylglycine-generating enzyme required for sulfatase activity